MKFSNTKSKQNFIKKFTKKTALVILIIMSLYLIISPKNEKLTNLSTSLLAEAYETTTYPIKKIKNYFNTIKESFTSISRLKKAEMLLIEKDLEIQKIKYIEAENKILKESLRFSKEKSYEFKSAEVIIDAQSSFSKSIIINNGTNNDMKKFQGVLFQGSIIGFINNVNKTNSRVLLITDPSSKLAVTNGRTRAILTGNNSNNPELKFIEEKEKIKDGDSLFTSGFYNRIPKGIFVGKLRIKNNKTYIELPKNPNNIDFVQIITNLKDVETIKTEEKELENVSIQD